jgi:hypothetical protein
MILFGGHITIHVQITFNAPQEVTSMLFRFRINAVQRTDHPGFEFNKLASTSVSILPLLKSF